MLHEYRLSDLNMSCERTVSGELINCQCYDAQRRVDIGEIECGSDVCPDDCFVCEYCMYYVVECGSLKPSTSPSALPSQIISGTPSASPTILPSLLPSSSPSFVPFDISDCGSFSNSW